MKHTLAFMLGALLATTMAYAQDLEAIALEILTASPLSAANCFVDSNGDGVRDGVKGSNFTIEDVRAITNRADVIAVVAAQAEDAADRATMSANLAALVQAQWGIAWTGQPAQVRQLRRRLIQDSQAAQAVIADNTKTVDQRFAALSTLRRLDAISGYYKELSGK